MVLPDTICRKTVLSYIVFVSSSNIQYKFYVNTVQYISSQSRYSTGQYRVSISGSGSDQVCKEYCGIQSSFDKVLILSFTCMYLIKSIMCVYAMFNEICKKHQYWCNCHVSVPAIGVETALSSTVLLHKYRYTSDADDTHDVYVSLRHGVMEVAIRYMHKLIFFQSKISCAKVSILMPCVNKHYLHTYVYFTHTLLPYIFFKMAW